MRFSQGLAAFVCVSATVGLTVSASGLALNGSGLDNTFDGTLGPVDIVAAGDSPSLNGGVSSAGVIEFLTPAVPIVRVKYELYNRPGNDPIFEFTVPYEPGVSVEGAANPGKFIDGGGATSTVWSGSNSTTLFDSGFGTYTADRTAFGSEWEIDFASDSVTWRYTGSDGFMAGTATGRTDLGSALPTFSIAFAAGTQLDLVVAEVSGRSVTGGPVSSSGRTLSGVVPEPASGMLVLGGVGLIAGRRR
jgi:hypothetical protein